MAAKSTFTSAEYLAQRAELEQQIRVAEDDHHRAGYRQVLGEASQDDVDKALVSLDALKNKRRSLEGAWEESKRQVASALADQQLKDRQDTISVIRELAGRRRKAAEDIASAIQSFGQAFQKYASAGSAITEAARPFMGTIGMDSFNAIRHAAENRGHEQMIVGLLREIGADFAGIDPTGAKSELDRHGGFSAWLDMWDRVLEQRIACLSPEQAA